MDYVKPTELIGDLLTASEYKSKLQTSKMLVSGMLSGAFLGFATSLSWTAVSQGLPAIVGALLFPVGFVMLVLLGFELVTGNFAVLPAGFAAGRVSGAALARNWFWVFFGNLLGSLLYALLFYWAVTNFGTVDSGAVGERIRVLAEKKTHAYSAIGPVLGWGSAIVKAILCNWMVTVGTVLAFSSRSTVGKVAAMWLPNLTFYGLGYEHSVVNMYLTPNAILFGAKITIADWWLWNQIPVTIGNIVGGAVCTGMAMFYLYGTAPSPAKAPSRITVPAAPVTASDPPRG